MNPAHSHDATGSTVAADLVVAELLTTAGLADPYTRLERLRAMGGAVPSTLGLVLTGYDDCQNGAAKPIDSQRSRSIIATAAR